MVNVRRACILATLAALAGCATLAPDTLRPEISHESHLGQHAPFTDHSTDHGRDIIGLAAIWRRGRWVGELSDGYNVHGGEGVFHDSPAGREVFEARLGYEIPLK